MGEDESGEDGPDTRRRLEEGELRRRAMKYVTSVQGLDHQECAGGKGHGGADEQHQPQHPLASDDMHAFCQLAQPMFSWSRRGTLCRQGDQGSHADCERGCVDQEGHAKARQRESSAGHEWAQDLPELSGPA